MVFLASLSLFNRYLLKYEYSLVNSDGNIKEESKLKREISCISKYSDLLCPDFKNEYKIKAGRKREFSYLPM